MGKQNVYLFKSIKQCFWTYIIFYLLGTGYTFEQALAQYVQMGTDMDIVSVVQTSHFVVLYAVIIFMYITYEYLTHAKKCFAQECLSVLPTSKCKQEMIQITICLLLSFLFFLGQLIVNIIFCFMLHTNYLGYILYLLKFLSCYMLLPMVIAVLFGVIASHFNNSVYAYVFLVFMTFYFAVRFYQLFYNSESLFGITDFTQFFCVSANHAAQYGYLFPIELHFVMKPFYIIGILLFILCVIDYYRMRSKKMILGLLALAIIVTVCIILWKIPCSGSYYGYKDREVDLYTEEDEQSKLTEQIDYYVKRYDMKLDFRNGLDAKVQMTVSNENVEIYKFTFFKQYIISCVTDLEGNPLEYERKENLLLIQNPNRNIKDIVIYYDGVCLNRYCFGKQGIYLPGNFPFYPIAGEYPIYESGLCELSENESTFRVEIQYDGKVYSNLEETTNSLWEGMSNQITLVSGYWKEVEIKGINIICPSVSALYDVEVNSYLQSAILDYSKKDDKKEYSLKGKKILIAPFGYESGNYMFGADMVIIGCKDDLDTFYTNYIQTGEWYLDDSLTDEEIQQLFKKNPL